MARLRAFHYQDSNDHYDRFEGRPLFYPNILGQSSAGVVENTGTGVSTFSIGDGVGVIRHPSKQSDHRFGAFQQYALASVESTSKLDPQTRLHDAAATILNLAAVASALSTYLNLARPTSTGPIQPKGEKVLLYGGSSSSGGLAIDFARAAGYEVVSTSSPSNLELVRSHGSKVAVLDHTQRAEKVVQDLHSHGPYSRILDTIGLPPVTKILVAYLSSLGGGSYSTLTALSPDDEPVPNNVRRNYEAYAWVFAAGGGERGD